MDNILDNGIYKLNISNNINDKLDNGVYITNNEAENILALNKDRNPIKEEDQGLANKTLTELIDAPFTTIKGARKDKLVT